MPEAVADAKTLLDAKGKSTLPLKELAQRWHSSMARVNLVLRDARGGKRMRAPNKTAPVKAVAPARRGRPARVASTGIGNAKLRQLIAKAMEIDAKLSAPTKQLESIPGIRPAEIRVIAKRSSAAIWSEFAEYLTTLAAAVAVKRRGRKPKKK
jgi:hypothetical protein